jgi:hypothetical protein
VTAASSGLFAASVAASVAVHWRTGAVAGKHQPTTLNFFGQVAGLRG